MTPEMIMRFMANVNRLINLIVIPFVIGAYGVFLSIEHKRINMSDIEWKHLLQSLETTGRVGGVIFGGSNAYYSLSAESLTNSIGVKWVNASVTNEADHVNLYNGFIQDLSARIERTKVEYVVYSSVQPYSIGQVAQSTGKLWGDGIKPKVSLLAYAGRFVERRITEPEQSKYWEKVFSRNRFGDLVLDKAWCAVSSERKQVDHGREQQAISANFLVEKAIFFGAEFPNAGILIVLPSGYYGHVTFDDSMFEEDLRNRVYKALIEKRFKSKFTIIFQPPYSSITQVCDSPWHGNEDGRHWRTQNLIASMHEMGIPISTNQVNMPELPRPPGILAGTASPAISIQR
jgi:hypothetical protein